MPSTVVRIGFALFVLVSSPAAQSARAGDPAAVCTGSKQKAAARYLDGLAACTARTVQSGATNADACLAMSGAKLVEAFAAAERRGGCASSGDASVVAGVADGCADILSATLGLDAAGLPATRCGGDKLRAAGRRLKTELTCHGKATARSASVTPSCLASAAARFEKSFTSAERRSDCVQTGDAAQAGGVTAACLTAVLQTLPSCSDGVRDGSETDVDCGGTVCGACQNGAVCSIGGDCQSGVCEGGVCAGPDSDAVCQQWTADRATLTEGAWSGNVASCTPGDVSAAGRASALRSMNLYRSLAGLPMVVDDPDRNAKAQACALMMHANGALRHDPPPSWSCFTAAGAEGAANSNIASTPGVQAVDLYMLDPGNPTTIGHRRWILSNWLDTVGLGSTSSVSCMWVVGLGAAGAPWTAWPPPGVVPYEALLSGGFGSVDSTGWTLQSDTIDLGQATVTVRENGALRPVNVTHLLDGYGSGQAIRFNPAGWQSAPGRSYEVTVGNVNPPIQYTVTVVDCG